MLISYTAHYSLPIDSDISILYARQKENREVSVTFTAEENDSDILATARKALYAKVQGALYKYDISQLVEITPCKLSANGIIDCYGCNNNSLAQEDHMDCPNGCLHTSNTCKLCEFC